MIEITADAHRVYMPINFKDAIVGLKNKQITAIIIVAVLYLAN